MIDLKTHCGYATHCFGQRQPDLKIEKEGWAVNVQLGSVKYIKVLYRFDVRIMCGPSQSRSSLKTMAQDIGGTDDWVAIYIPTKGDDPKYRGKIGAFLQVSDLNGKSVHDYGSETLECDWNPNNRWPVGVPVQNWQKLRPCDAIELKPLVTRLGEYSDWYRMIAALRNGPINLGGTFPYLVDPITLHFQKKRESLLADCRA